MLGISYGELFLILGATAAFIGPKDLPFITRTAGRLAGRAIGYIQMARGHFDNIMHHSQASQVHKELQETMAQLEAIRYEIRGLSIMNPGPMKKQLMDGAVPASSTNGRRSAEKVGEKKTEGDAFKDHSGHDVNSTAIHRLQDHGANAENSTTMHSRAMAYARLAESSAAKTASLTGSGDLEKVNDDAGPFTVLPVSAESAGLLPKRHGDAKGSDIMLDAIVEAEVAHNAKQFFAQPENQIRCE